MIRFSAFKIYEILFSVLVDASTITDAAATSSLPQKTPQTSKKTIDKNLSPIGSPIRKLDLNKHFKSSSVQTENGVTYQIKTAIENDGLKIYSSNMCDSEVQTDPLSKLNIVNNSTQTAPLQTMSTQEDTLENKLIKANKLAETRNDLLEKAEKE